MGKKYTKKTKTNQSKTITNKKVVKKKTSSSSFVSKLTNNQLLIITLCLTLAIGCLSFISTGMYQGEEGIHYMNMKDFWNNPNKILGNWAKPGWKLIYVIPSLLGYKFLHFFNAFITVAAGVFAYKYLAYKKFSVPWLAIVLLFSQFFLVQMAFRNYSELLAALLIVAALYFHEKNKWIVSALLVSYLLIIRQEWLPIIGLYGIFLLYKRAFIPVLLIGLFPALINFWGWIATDDPLYFLNNALRTSKGYSERYPRQGFLHYFKASTPMFGSLVILGLTAYFVSLYEKRFKPNYFLIIPSIAFFLLMCVLNIKEPKIGTATGGNWRYMIAIMPLMAIMASQGWERMTNAKDKLKYWIAVGVVGLMMISFGAYEHNYIGLSTIRDSWLTLSVLATLILAFLPLSMKIKSFSILVLALVFNVIIFEPRVLVGENKAIKELIPWLEKQNIESQPIIHVNKMIDFFWDKTESEYENGYYALNEENINKAPVGTYIMWDSHYSVRYGKLDYKYFQDRPDRFKLIRQVISDDKRFGMIIFQKIAP